MVLKTRGNSVMTRRGFNVPAENFLSSLGSLNPSAVSTPVLFAPRGGRLEV